MVSRLKLLIENGSIANIGVVGKSGNVDDGSGDNVGLPPLVSHLNGYGKYVLNDIPVLITNFTVDMPADVDYIAVSVPGDNAPNYVPTKSQISVTLVPNYARRAVSRFNLKKFADGGFVGKVEGFV
jgi:hypothetical protein